MVKATPHSSQEKLRSFFKDIVMSEPGVDGALADRVAERCVKHIDLLLQWDRGRVDATTNPLALQVPPSRSLQPVPSAPVTARAPAGGGRAFDPYAFSVVVTLVKKGREALLARLLEIDSAEHLRQLANAQHLGIDPKLSKLDDLRAAIVHGAERRIAGRRAAAT